MSYSKMPREEIEVFKRLPDLKVIFDVGSRDDTEYYDIYPNAEFHLFEPNPISFLSLQEKFESNLMNIHLNNFGLSNEEKEEKYNDGWQAFLGGENTNNESAWNKILPLKTLDQYIEDHNVKKIDFLKIDTEGYDYKVLLGGLESLPNIRFIQYEHWNDKKQFYWLLGELFDLENIGYRNVLCMNRKFVDVDTRNNIRKYIDINKLSTLH